MSGSDVEVLLTAIEEIRESLERLAWERERAEVLRALDAMPFPELDIWLRAAQAAVVGARQSASAWVDVAGSERWKSANDRL